MQSRVRPPAVYCPRHQAPPVNCPPATPRAKAGGLLTAGTQPMLNLLLLLLHAYLYEHSL